MDLILNKIKACVFIMVCLRCLKILVLKFWTALCICACCNSSTIFHLCVAI